MHKEIIEMKTLVQFCKNFLMFLILPFTWYQIESFGRVGHELDTMLRENYRRSYSGSVLEPLMLWVLFVCNITLYVIMIVMVVKNDHTTMFLVIMNIYIWFLVLIPIINRSYEAVNWRKAGFLSLGLRYQRLSKDEFKRAVKKFLVHNLVIAIKDGSNKEFDHLEHVLRVMDFWKGTRTELLDELDRTEK